MTNDNSAHGVHPDITIDTDISYHLWQDCGLALEKIVSEAIEKTLQAVPLPQDIADKNLEISVVLTSDENISILNREYRGKDGPTNVLSFPLLGSEPLFNPVALGDIVLAYETVMREAEEQKKTPADHFSHLLVHGVLHLAGYDHIKDKEAEIMEQLEIRILNDMGIKNPYTDIDFMP